MSMSSGLGLGFRPRADGSADRTEYLLVQRPIQRILASTRRSIDDVVNDPIVKREVLGYYKLFKRIARSIEVTDLERQWNAVA